MKPYFEDAAVKIYHGNCLEVMGSLGSGDHVITDPPYSEHTHAKQWRGGAELPKTGEGRVTRAGICRSRELGFAALSPDTRFRAASAFAEIANRWTLIFSDVESCHLWREDLVAHDLDYVRTGAWRKLGSTPQFTGDRPATGFETITIAHTKGRKRWNGGGSHGVWDYPIVINRSHSQPRLHTAQKPLALMARLIELFTDPGEVILDAFMGSGTTLRAAKDLGRQAIGVDLDESDCETAAKRMSQGVLAFS